MLVEVGDWISVRKGDGAVLAFDFSRKARALQDLARRGKLRRAANPVARDREITVRYKYRLIRSLADKYRKTDPARFSRLRAKVLQMEADHVHELQLLGADDATNLWLLDRDVNWGIGQQIWQQIRSMDVGTWIDDVLIISP